jgi:hypothetical protein
LFYKEIFYTYNIHNYTLRINKYKIKSDVKKLELLNVMLNIHIVNVIDNTKYRLAILRKGYEIVFRSFEYTHLNAYYVQFILLNNFNSK